MEENTNETLMANPTNESEPSHEQETVEVGVIVMGVCCICLVACALVILQLRSNNRRITGHRHRSENADSQSADRSRDPLDVGAPPSYDAVIRSPHLYPPFRRTSLTTALDTRRSSGSSTFSLSVHSPRIIHHTRDLHSLRRSSRESVSQPIGNQTRGSYGETREQPPPPYPGNTDLNEAQSAASMEPVELNSGRRSTGINTRLSDLTNGISPCFDRTERRFSSHSNDTEPSVCRVIDAWTHSVNGQVRCHSNDNVRLAEATSISVVNEGSSVSGVHAV